MKNALLSLLIIILTSHLCFATIRRVGYNGTPKAGVDYIDFTAAHAASFTGDTIQLYGGSHVGTINKRLVIMGFGYNLDANPNLQATSSDVPSNAYLTFTTGSDSSIVEGCSGSFTIGNQANLPVGAIVSKVIVRRCYGSIALYNYNAPVNDIKIISCAATNIYLSSSLSTAFACTNLQVYNSIIQNVNIYFAGSSGSLINCVTVAPSMTSASLSLNTAAFLVKNCILNPYSTFNLNTVYENNFFNTAQPVQVPTGVNNHWGVQWLNIFNRLANNDNASLLSSTDFDEDYFVLKPGSAAIGAGYDANNNLTDCGIYGGDPIYRYKLGGVPAVPAIYKLTAPNTAATSNPYIITVGARSNN